MKILIMKVFKVAMDHFIVMSRNPVELIQFTGMNPFPLQILPPIVHGCCVIMRQVDTNLLLRGQIQECLAQDKIFVVYVERRTGTRILPASLLGKDWVINVKVDSMIAGLTVIGKTPFQLYASMDIHSPKNTGSTDGCEY